MIIEKQVLIKSFYLEIKRFHTAKLSIENAIKINKNPHLVTTKWGFFMIFYYATPGTIKSMMSNNVGKIKMDKTVEAKKILDACSCSTFQL